MPSLDDAPVGEPKHAPGEAREDRAVDGAVRRARTKLRDLGVEIHGITGVGYLLEVGTPVP